MENHDQLLSLFSMTLCHFPIAACFSLYLAYFSCYFDHENITHSSGTSLKNTSEPLYFPVL